MVFMFITDTLTPYYSFEGSYIGSQQPSMRPRINFIFISQFTYVRNKEARHIN